MLPIYLIIITTTLLHIDNNNNGNLATKIEVVARYKQETHLNSLMKKDWKSGSHHLQSLSFLKNDDTVDFGQGFVARQVAKFSGCSIHSLWATPPAFSFSDKFNNWVSPFTSRVTCIYTKKSVVNKR